MAKQISVLDALNALAAAGIELTDAHREQLADITKKALAENAISIFAGDDKHLGKLVDKEKNNAAKFTAKMFEFADTLGVLIVSEVIGRRGGGSLVTVRRFVIETPSGVLKVTLEGGETEEN